MLAMNNKSSLFGCLPLLKWIKRLGAKDLLELSPEVMKLHVIIEDRSVLEALRVTNWQGVKMSLQKLTPPPPTRRKRFTYCKH